MTPDDELRAIAEAATPGPWHSIFNHDNNLGNVFNEGRIIAETNSGWDTEFIATFDPECVKGLLDRIAKAEAEVKRLQGELQEMTAIALTLRTRIGPSAFDASDSGPWKLVP